MELHDFAYLVKVIFAQPLTIEDVDVIPIDFIIREPLPPVEEQGGIPNQDVTDDTKTDIVEVAEGETAEGVEHTVRLEPDESILDQLDSISSIEWINTTTGESLATIPVDDSSTVATLTYNGPDGLTSAESPGNTYTFYGGQT